MAVSDAYVFPGFLTPVLTQLFFPKPPITFLTCFCIGERRKNIGKESCLNLGSNSQPPGHKSYRLTIEPHWLGRSAHTNGSFDKVCLACKTEIMLHTSIMQANSPLPQIYILRKKKCINDRQSYEQKERQDTFSLRFGSHLSFALLLERISQ